MNCEKNRALIILGIFCLLSSTLGILLSDRLTVVGLWLMPSFYHLYPLAASLIVVFYSIVTSRKILLKYLIIVIGLGLLLECLFFWLTKQFMFNSQKVLALFIFGEVFLVYGVTLGVYFCIASRRPPSE